MSRSDTMPAMRDPSATTSAPMLRSSNSATASATDASAPTVTTSWPFPYRMCSISTPGSPPRAVRRIRPRGGALNGAMSIDVQRARADTPGCERVVHLNHAGASLPPRPVLDAQIEWLRAEAVTGGYELAADREADHQRTYEEVAALIGARPDEIALGENATFAWHQAFWSLPLRPGDRILTCTVEYASSYVSFLQAARRRGVTVEVIPDDEHGQVSVEALTQLLDDRRGPVGLVAIAHVPTNGGLVNPAAEVGAACRAAGVPFLLDACQSVGQLPVDVGAIGCDLLSATGRKFLRAARHRLPVRAPVVSGPTRALGARGAIGRLDRPRHLSRQGRGAALRDLGNELRGAARPRRRHRLRARPGPRRNLGARSPPGGPPPPRA